MYVCSITYLYLLYYIMLIYDIRHGGTISWQLAGNKSYCHGLVCHGVESKRMGDGTLLHMRVHRHYKDLLLRGG